MWGSEQGPFWRVETTPQILNDVTAINDTMAIVVGDSGLIMRNTQIINSVKEEVVNVQVKMFPNPASQYFSVAVDIGTVLQVEVYDMLGRLVVLRETAFNEIPVSEVDPGLYHVRVKTTHGIKVMPLLVQ